MAWHPESEPYLIAESYEALVKFYELAVYSTPENVSNYWYLGLSYLLAQQEELAQTTCFFVLSQGNTEQIEQWTQQITDIFEIEAQRQEANQNLESAWLIRQYIREVNPYKITNLIQLIYISIKLNIFDINLVKDWNIVEILKNSSDKCVDSKLLLSISTKMLAYLDSCALEFIDASLDFIDEPQKWISLLIVEATKIADQYGRPDFSAKIAEVCLDLDKYSSSTLQYLCIFHDKAGDYKASFEAARKYFKTCHSLASKLLGSYLMTEAYIHSHGWIGAESYIIEYKNLLRKVIEVSSLKA